MLNIIRNIFNVLQCKTYKQTNANNTKQQNSKILLTGVVMASIAIGNTAKNIKNKHNLSDIKTKQLDSGKQNTLFLGTENIKKVSIPSEINVSDTSEINNSNKITHKNLEKIINSILNDDISQKPDLEYEKVDQILDNMFLHGKTNIFPQSNQFITLGCSLNSVMAIFLGNIAKYLKEFISYANAVKNKNIIIQEENKEDLFTILWCYKLFAEIDIDNQFQVSEHLFVLLKYYKILPPNMSFNKQVNIYDISIDICSLIMDFTNMISRIPTIKSILIANNYRPEFFKANMNNDDFKNIYKQDICQMLSFTTDIFNIKVEENTITNIIQKKKWHTYTNTEKIKNTINNILSEVNTFLSGVNDQEIIQQKIYSTIEEQIDNLDYLIALYIIIDTYDHVHDVNNRHLLLNIHLLIDCQQKENNNEIQSSFDITHIENNKLYHSCIQEPIDFFLLYSIGHYFSILQYKEKILMMDMGNFYIQDNWDMVFKCLKNWVELDNNYEPININSIDDSHNVTHYAIHFYISNKQLKE